MSATSELLVESWGKLRQTTLFWDIINEKFEKKMNKWGNFGFEGACESIWSIVMGHKVQNALNAVKRLHSWKKIVVRHKYSRYLHQTNAVVITITSTIIQIKLHLSSTIIGRNNLLVHATVCQMLSWWIKNSPHSISVWDIPHMW